MLTASDQEKEAIVSILQTRRVSALAAMVAILLAIATASASPADAKTEVVKPGDTAAGIADENGTSLPKLIQLNPAELNNPNLIYPGETLDVPGGKSVSQVNAVVAVEPDLAPAPRPAPKPEPAPKPRPAATPVPAPSPAPSGGVWDSLAACESGGNWSINTGNGFYGGLQFTLSSWAAVGGSGLPSEASKAEQIMRAQQLQSMQGWGAWPSCASQLGLL